MNFYILNLGCAKNQVDSEELSGLLEAAGHKIVGSAEDAEVAIVNTCGFIRPAVEESVDAILDLEVLKRQGNLKKIGVVGCLVKRYGEDLKKEVPTVDFWAGPQEWDKVLNALGTEKLGHQRILMPNDPFWTRYLKISEGCNEKCSYCTIPSIRGSLKSIPIDMILEEAEELISSGARELCVISQDPTAYGMDLYGKPSLKNLIGELDRSLPDGVWARLLYLHPKRIDEELLEMVNDSRVVLPYLDIPIQHVDLGILTRMNRLGPWKDPTEIFRIARRINPFFALRTTLMVGFPGETEDEFNELLEFIEGMQLDRVGAFTFYPEEGTAAASMPLQVADEVKEARYTELMEVQEKMSLKRQKLFEGTNLDVLVEEVDQEGEVYWGRSYRDAPEVDGSVCIESDYDLEPGTIVKVKVKEASEHDLFGEVIVR